jgi:sigma-B regulation protein RsbU (phosphoserine phosphatase)
MTKRQHGRLKNCLLWANFISNLIGVIIVYFLLRRLYYPLEESILRASDHVNMVFTPGAFLLCAFLTLLYERPIRAYLDLQYKGESIPAELVLNARRKLLNEPFFLITVDFGLWLLAAVVFSTLYWGLGASQEIILRPIIMNLITGLITVTVAFFVIEHHLQKRLFPHFFPEGGISTIPNTLRIRISTKLAAVLLACNIIPFIAILSLFSALSQAQKDPMGLFEQIRLGTFTLAFVFMATSTWLIMLVSSNLSNPFKEIVHVLQGIRNGRFENRVRVISNDEIGYTGDVVNEMTEGLKERERMRQSLELAMEVQRSLLPQTNPITKGFDIAGASIYCDETGGDYFDYLDICEKNEGKTAVVIGDVSGHGIPSALLMATGRAFLRLRSSLPGSISSIVTDVNRQLTRDVTGSGQFMTLFFLELDSTTGRMRWIRAGHDPAILYHPNDDTFEELLGEGLVLGIDENWVYEENEKFGLKRGQILFLGTDGIWEAHNPQGDMFGKEAIRNIIRQEAKASAADIQEAILNALSSFQGDAEPEDDKTLVVIKVLEDL